MMDRMVRIVLQERSPEALHPIPRRAPAVFKTVPALWAGSELPVHQKKRSPVDLHHMPSAGHHRFSGPCQRAGLVQTPDSQLSTTLEDSAGRSG